MRDITVAIKVTKKFLSEKAMSDFKNEMSIMSEVSHNNIVRLYGIISEGMCYALPMLLQPLYLKIHVCTVFLQVICLRL